MAGLSPKPSSLCVRVHACSALAASQCDPQRSSRFFCDAHDLRNEGDLSNLFAPNVSLSTRSFPFLFMASLLRFHPLPFLYLDSSCHKASKHKHRGGGGRTRRAGGGERCSRRQHNCTHCHKFLADIARIAMAEKNERELTSLDHPSSISIFIDIAYRVAQRRTG